MLAQSFGNIALKTFAQIRRQENVKTQDARMIIHLLQFLTDTINPRRSNMQNVNKREHDSTFTLSYATSGDLVGTGSSSFDLLLISLICNL